MEGCVKLAALNGGPIWRVDKIGAAAVVRHETELVVRKAPVTKQEGF
jgi:hypothetical protein